MSWRVLPSLFWAPSLWTRQKEAHARQFLGRSAVQDGERTGRSCFSCLKMKDKQNHTSKLVCLEDARWKTNGQCSVEEAVTFFVFWKVNHVKIRHELAFAATRFPAGAAASQ